MAAKNESCNCSPTERLDKRLLRETWGLMPKPANPRTREYWYIYLWEKLFEERGIILSHTGPSLKKGPALESPAHREKALRACFTGHELSPRYKPYQLLYRWSRCHSTFNFSTDLNKDKQSLSSCTRTGSLYNTPQRLLLNYGFCWLFGIPFQQPSPERCWVPPQGAKHPPRT